jgi:hypothetical protein
MKGSCGREKLEGVLIISIGPSENWLQREALVGMAFEGREEDA